MEFYGPTFFVRNAFALVEGAGRREGEEGAEKNDDVMPEGEEADRDDSMVDEVGR